MTYVKNNNSGFFSPYKALIFDLDNTLAATEVYHIKALADALEEMLGYNFTYADSQEYIGITSREMSTRVLQRLGRQDFTPEEISRRKQELVMKSYQAQLYPGVAEFLRMQQRNYLLAIASNSPRNFILNCLQRCDIMDYFTQIVHPNETLKPKPEPDIFFKTAELLGVSPQECLVFEDSSAGLTAARSGGFAAVLVLNPGNPLPEPLPTEAAMLSWPQLISRI